MSLQINGRLIRPRAPLLFTSCHGVYVSFILQALTQAPPETSCASRTESVFPSCIRSILTSPQARGYCFTAQVGLEIIVLQPWLPNATRPVLPHPSQRTADLFIDLIPTLVTSHPKQMPVENEMMKLYNSRTDMKGKASDLISIY